MIDNSSLGDGTKKVLTSDLNFWKGVGEGVYDAGKGIVSGAKSAVDMMDGQALVNAGTKVAAAIGDDKARDSLIKEVEGDVNQVNDAANAAANPLGTLLKMGKSAYDGYTQAAAQGKGDEYIGQLGGKVAVNVLLGAAGGGEAGPGEGPPPEGPPPEGPPPEGPPLEDAPPSSKAGPPPDGPSSQPAVPEAPPAPEDPPPGPLTRPPPSEPPPAPLPYAPTAFPPRPVTPAYAPTELPPGPAPDIRPDVPPKENPFVPFEDDGPSRPPFQPTIPRPPRVPEIVPDPTKLPLGGTPGAEPPPTDFTPRETAPNGATDAAPPPEQAPPPPPAGDLPPEQGSDDGG